MNRRQKQIWLAIAYLSVCSHVAVIACPDTDADKYLARLSPNAKPVLIPQDRQIPYDANAKRVLVLLHGILSDGGGMGERAIAAYSLGDFDQVIAPTYDWTDKVATVAPKLFETLHKAYPNAKFVFDGHSKGGMVAKYIVERVRASDGLVERLITESSPLGGADLAGYQKYYPYNGRPGVIPGNSPVEELVAKGVNLRSPGVTELAADSDLVNALSQDPLNNLSDVDYVQLWGSDDSIVSRESALAPASSKYGQHQQLIIAAPDEATGHSGVASFLTQHYNLYRRLLQGDLPPEASKGALKLSTGCTEDKSKIPPGWVACTCVGEHEGLGIWFGNTYYHDPAYFCP